MNVGRLKTDARLPMTPRALISANVVLGAWLAFLGSRQTPLYPTIAHPATELLPVELMVGVVVVAAVGRLLARSTIPAVLCMLVTMSGIASLAAQLGSPLANASGGVVGGDYCGDFCRTAIAFRFVTFFLWPFVGATLLVLLGRRDTGTEAAIDRSRWTRALAKWSLLLGLVSSAAWWRIVLP